MVVSEKTDFIPLHQPKKGYRYGIDSLLLARFADLRSSDRVCDLGSGVGILALWALTKRKVAQAVAIEVQKDLAELALKNAEVLGVKDRLEVFCENWKRVKGFLKPHSFQVLISNPPYRRANTGKPPPDTSKAIAKHEVEGAMPDLIKAAAYLMKPSGRFCVMYPPLRLEELIAELAKAKLKVQRMAFIHPFQDRPATLVMVEAVRSMPRELKVEPPIVVYRDPEHYTPEVEAWVGPKRRV
ncbi:MAG: methyltransferase [Deltaproteobacteria bacterium]|nr:methyltransferase [Deltaproteobacteria bacterium]